MRICKVASVCVSIAVASAAQGAVIQKDIAAIRGDQSRALMGNGRGVIGYADDVIVVALVLRSVVKGAGPDAVAEHWTGTPDGLALVKRLCSVRA